MKIRDVLNLEGKDIKYYKIVDWTEKAKCKKCEREGVAWVVLTLDIQGGQDNYIGATVLCGSCVAAMRNLVDRDLIGNKYWDIYNRNGGTILCLHCGWSDIIKMNVRTGVDREIIYNWYNAKKKYHECNHYLP
jgi:hypothetical protein